MHINEQEYYIVISYSDHILLNSNRQVVHKTKNEVHFWDGFRWDIDVKRARVYTSKKDAEDVAQLREKAGRKNVHVELHPKCRYQLD